MDTELSLLPGRNALSDHSGTISKLLFERLAGEEPLLTIAIPTFRRDELLVQALVSAASQDADLPIEILVLDNEPTSSGKAGGSVALDSTRHSIRYYVNEQNIGMFGNWNRCIELARGKWLTILSDDDLLDPAFASRMLQLLAREPSLDALICRKRILDERDLPGSDVTSTSRGAELLRAISFRGRSWRRIGARHLFWGNVIGNSGGLVVRTRIARELGGFDPNDFPSADYYFHTRLALAHRLAQSPETLVTVRVAANESMKPEVLYGFLRTGYRMQQALAGTYLPSWWRRISPWLIARHVGELSHAWNVALDRARVEAEMHVRLPPDRPRRVKLMRLLLGGL